MRLRQLLYLIESGGLYKIGISQDINKRLKGLQTGSPHPVRCIAYYTTKESARSVEGKLHKLFHKYRLSGEWFDFEGKFTLDAFNTLCEKFGMQPLSFNDDGSCAVVEEVPTVKKKKAFGDIPNSSPPTRTKEEDVIYWRRRYGIKTKGR